MAENPFQAAIALKEASQDNPFAAAIKQRQQGSQTALPIGDVPGQAAANFPSNAAQVAGDMWEGIKGLVTGETWGNLGRLGLGVAQSASVDPRRQVDPSLDMRPVSRAVGSAMGEHLGQYTTWEGAKKMMAERPAEFLMDLATVGLLGGGAVAQAPGRVGQVGRIAANPVGEAIGAAGKGVGAAVRPALGMTTGAGPKPIREAYRAGREGGEASQRFLDAMRGNLPMETVVDDARGAVANLYRQRGERYRENRELWSQDPQVLDFTKVDSALKDVAGVKSFKGVPISKSTEAVRKEIADTVERWRGLDPAEYHTVEGFDALKQSLDDIAEAQQYGTPSWRVANEARQAVWQTINDQAPGYATAMREYSQATKLLQEIQKELSLGPKGNPSTALRKLQAIIRDDVSSAYGRRAELAGELEAAGATQLTPTLSGQAMSSILPRGLRGPVTAVGGATGLGVAGASNPLALALLPGVAAAASPRIVGEAMHGAGVMSRALAPVPPVGRGLIPAYQAGRMEELLAGGGR